MEAKLKSPPISYFPKIYPGELFFSAVARMIDHSLSKQEPVIEAYLQSAYNKTHWFFPRIRFDELNNLPAETIIQYHTLFPFFEQIMKSEDSGRLRDYMLTNSLNANRVFKKPTTNYKILRFCPLCIEYDIQTFGETYWHREHNLPAVSTCTIHNCFLEKWNPPIEENVDGKVHSAQRNLIGNYEVKHNSNEFLSVFDRRLVDVLNMRKPYQISDIITIGIDKGFVRKANSRFFIDENEFTQFSQWTSNIDPSLTERLARKKKIYGVFNNRCCAGELELQILLAAFLETRAGKIECAEKQRKNRRGRLEIRTRSYSCINKICPDFERRQSPNISTFTTISNSLQVTCKCCGMVYSVVDREQNIITKVLYWGALTQQKVKRLKGEGMSFEKIARHLNISYPVLKRMFDSTYTNRFNLSKESIRTDLESKRELWLKEIKSKQFRSIQESSRKIHKVYLWLMTFDRPWIIETNKTYRRVAARIQKYSSKSDDEILDRLKNAKATLLQSDRRVTCNSLFSLIGSDLRPAKERLPKSFKFIAENIETFFEFKMRRVVCYLDAIKESGEPLSTKYQFFVKFSLMLNSKTEQDELFQLAFG